MVAPSVHAAYIIRDLIPHTSDRGESLSVVLHPLHLVSKCSVVVHSPQKSTAVAE